MDGKLPEKSTEHVVEAEPAPEGNAAGVDTPEDTLPPTASQSMTQLLQPHVSPNPLLPNRPGVLPPASWLAGLPSATQAASPAASLRQVSLLGQLESILLAKKAAGLPPLAATQRHQALYLPSAQPALAQPNSLVASQLSDSGQSNQLLRRVMDPNSNAQGRSQLHRGLIDDIMEVNQLEGLVSQQEAGLAAQDQTSALLLRQLLGSSSLLPTAQDQSGLLRRLVREITIKDNAIALMLARQQTAFEPAAAPLSQISVLGANSAVPDAIPSNDDSGRPGTASPTSESEQPQPYFPDSLGFPTECGENKGVSKHFLYGPGSCVLPKDPRQDSPKSLLGYIQTSSIQGGGGRPPSRRDDGASLPDRAVWQVKDLRKTRRQAGSSKSKQVPHEQKRVRQESPETELHTPALCAKRQKTRTSRQHYSQDQYSEALSNLAEAMRRSEESRKHVIEQRRRLPPETRHALSLARDRLRRENERVKSSAVGGLFSLERERKGLRSYMGQVELRTLQKY